MAVTTISPGNSGTVNGNNSVQTLFQTPATANGITIVDITDTEAANNASFLRKITMRAGPSTDIRIYTETGRTYTWSSLTMVIT